MTQYQTYVENGNVPLTELPPWMTEVAQLVAKHRGRMQAKQQHKRAEKKRARQLQRQFGYA